MGACCRSKNCCIHVYIWFATRQRNSTICATADTNVHSTSLGQNTPVQFHNASPRTLHVKWRHSAFLPCTEIPGLQSCWLAAPLIPYTVPTPNRFCKALHVTNVHVWYLKRRSAHQRYKSILLTAQVECEAHSGASSPAGGIAPEKQC